MATTMKCENCGKEIEYINLDFFNYDGSDDYCEVPFYTDGVSDNIIMDVNSDWTGYELSEEEQMETIVCPCCKKFPFKHKEVQVYNIVRVVCFADKENK